jgi:hypothetical protein
MTKYLTLETPNVRVWLDGVEVTNEVFYAEVPDAAGREAWGRVARYVRKANGAFNVLYTSEYGEKPEPFLEAKISFGRVRWELKEADGDQAADK